MNRSANSFAFGYAVFLAIISQCHFRSDVNAHTKFDVFGVTRFGSAHSRVVCLSLINNNFLLSLAFFGFVWYNRYGVCEWRQVPPAFLILSALA